MHRLLRRQLRRYDIDPDAVPEALRGFVDAVDTAYRDADEDRLLMERALEISAEERVESERVLVAKLRNKNDELARFAYVASHDLRAPLRAIESLVEWLEADLDDSIGAESRKHLSMLRARAQRMATLLEDLLDYARLGSEEATIETVDVADMIGLVVDMLSPPDGFVVEVGEMPTFDTARSPLERVLLNLIANALKHHDRENGRILIRCHDSGDAYRFEVEDDGPGIPADKRDEVFQMFQTLKSGEDRDSTGMGLALIKRICESAGGRVSVRDASPSGAIFTFTWPKSWRG